MAKNLPPKTTTAAPLQTSKHLILASRCRVDRTVISGLALLYGNIGKQIKTDVLLNKRAGFGGKIVEQLAVQRTAELGRRWTKQPLRNCRYTAATFPSQNILSALPGKLSQHKNSTKNKR